MILVIMPLLLRFYQPSPESLLQIDVSPELFYKCVAVVLQLLFC